MTLEVFVRASGVAMGLARDSFGVKVSEGVGLKPTPGPSPPLVTAASNSGRAASAFSTESAVVDGHVTALGEQDLAANSDLVGALAAAGAGRDQMDTVIASALGDISSLAAATTTPAGRQALVNALARRLEQTWQAMTNGQADASTRAASSAQVAAAYGGLGAYPGGLTSTMPVTPMAAMSPMQSMPMLSAATMAANQAAMSTAAQISSAQQQTPSNGSTQSATLTSATGQARAVVQRAMKELGVPYSWGGGGLNGPSRGIQQGSHTVGFDCAGLVQYAYAPYVHLPRTTYGQIGVGHTVSRSDIQAGDLIFSEFGEGGDPGPGHVQLAISSTQVVEAPHTGADVRVGGIPAGHIVVRRILG